jgi:hypothetical protein
MTTNDAQQMTSAGQMTNNASSQSEKPIALVESAKTAIIMTGFYPDYIWMATNGSANLNPTILKPLLHRNIILYPDLGQYDKWCDKAIDLQKQGFLVTVSNLLETNATPEDRQSGLDIADYFITHQLPRHLWLGLSEPPNNSPHFQITKFSNSKKALSKDDTLFNSFAIKYPSILNLADALELVNPKTNKPFCNVTTL